MTIFAHTKSGRHAVAAHNGIWRLLAEVCRAMAQLIKNRHDTARLLEMSDDQLKDIGLTRDDVAAALSVPLTRDPSRVLASYRYR